MTLVRWRPTTDLLPLVSNMQREIHQLFDSFFRGDLRDESSYCLQPAVDIIESDDAYEIEAEMPGMTKDDIKVTIEGNVLTIRGEKKQEKTEKGKNYHRTERSFGTFVRSFTIPDSVKTDKIEAKHENGIITITLPKQEEVKPKPVDVKIK